MTISTPSDTNDTTLKVSCDCIPLTNEALKAYNCELALSFEIGRHTGLITTTVALRTVLLEKKRGAKALNILASFCPFCGTPYDRAPERPETTESAP